MRINTVKQALKEGKTQFGCSTSMLRCPEVPRILAAAGLNWTYLDSEHGAFDLETLQDLIRAANDSGLCPIVRVADLQYALVARALDCGAQGVLFPPRRIPRAIRKSHQLDPLPPRRRPRLRPPAHPLKLRSSHHARNHRAHEREHHGGAANRNPHSPGSHR